MSMGRVKVQPADALLVIDMGNTGVDLAIYDEDGLQQVRRAETHAAQSWTEPIRDLWHVIGDVPHRAVALASVCPPQTSAMIALLEDLCGVEPLQVRTDLPLPMPVDVESPEDVGVDRVCACAAAYERVQEACAVASFGTATTVDCVSPDGRFLGGAILPGLAMSLEALHLRTAQLPHIDLALPEGPIGRNTQDAILSGVLYGMVGAVREIVERFATELREWPHLVVTGGNAAVVHELADYVDSVSPHLILQGIALTHRRAAGQA